jgi:hypothetical protein
MHSTRTRTTKTSTPNGSRRATEPMIQVNVPVWALPHLVRFVRFLRYERQSGPGVTRLLLDGQGLNDTERSN